MHRRTFMTGLIATGASLPPIANAQQSRLPVVGFFRNGSATSQAHLFEAFGRGLRNAGFVEGQNVVIEQRWSDGQDERLQELATDLVRHSASVIVTNNVGAIAAKKATSKVPIVFAMGGDPVKDGLVSSINRPGGNLTGIVFISGALASKRLEILQQIVSKGTTIGLLTNLATNETAAERDEILVAAQRLQQPVLVDVVSSVTELADAFATARNRGVGAMVVGTGAFLNNNRERVVALATRHVLPALYPLREYVSSGGLMSYGTSITEAYYQAGLYAGRILNGDKPADLPVMQSARFEFILNLKTAQAQGVTFPDKILALADEVIE